MAETTHSENDDDRIGKRRHRKQQRLAWIAVIGGLLAFLVFSGILTQGG